MKKQEKFASKKKYFSATEVAKLLNIKLHTLYYWEEKLSFIKSKKILKRRFYPAEEIPLLFKVKELLDEGYSLEGIKRLFSKVTHEKKPSLTLQEALSLLQEVKRDLEKIYQNL